MSERRASSVKEQRSDARRNREAILDAARHLLAESGDVPMYEIARRAGVGQGTLYRNFPDRAAVAAAIFDQQLDDIEGLVGESPDDPRLRFSLILDGLGQALVQFHGLGEVLREVPAADQERHLFDRFTALMEEPIAQARSAGHLRPDVTVADLLLLCGMLDGALATIDKPEDRATTAKRVISIVLDGLSSPHTSAG